MFRVTLFREHELSDRLAIFAYFHLQLMLLVFVGLNSFDGLQEGLPVSLFVLEKVIKQPIRVMTNILFYYCLMLVKLGLRLIDTDEIRLIFDILNKALMLIGGESFGEK